MVADETLEEVAENARLELTDEEKAKFGRDMKDILDAFESLDEIDCEGVEPAFHPIELDERSREDATEECFDQDAALSNSENTEDGYFKGPRAT